MEKSLRRLNENDIEILYFWRIQPEIRNNSFDKSEFSLVDHKKWFQNVIKSNLVFAYILEVDFKPVGVIRFDIEDRELARINYLIDPLYHGKGFGTQILELGIKRISLDNSQIKKVYGHILKQNMASIRIFKKLNFIKISENTSELKFEKSIE